MSITHKGLNNFFSAIDWIKGRVSNVCISLFALVSINILLLAIPQYPLMVTLSYGVASVIVMLPLIMLYLNLSTVADLKDAKDTILNEFQKVSGTNSSDKAPEASSEFKSALLTLYKIKEPFEQIAKMGGAAIEIKDTIPTVISLCSPKTPVTFVFSLLLAFAQLIVFIVLFSLL